MKITVHPQTRGDPIRGSGVKELGVGVAGIRTADNQHQTIPQKCRGMFQTGDHRVTDPHPGVASQVKGLGRPQQLRVWVDEAPDGLGLR